MLADPAVTAHPCTHKRRFFKQISPALPSCRNNNGGQGPHIIIFSNGENV